jgi:hypothetical protein
MYDIDPPSPILHLSAPRKATQPTALTDRQHLARLAQSDPIANRHNVGAVIHQLKILAEADGSLAPVIRAL